MTKPSRRVTLKVLGATLGASVFVYTSHALANGAARLSRDDLLRSQ